MHNCELEKILSYIDAHIHERISLYDISSLAGYSPFYFSKLFANAIGMPVTSYIRIRKLQHAVVSLLEGNRVIDVALMYAFESHEGFTRAFSQFFGMTPNSIKNRILPYSVPDYHTLIHSDRRQIINMGNYLVNLEQNMHQMLFETVQNAIDEARATNGIDISIIVFRDNVVEVSDTGRGIPFVTNASDNRRIAQKILYGKPITNAEYSQMGDISGAGLQVVNSLSESFTVDVVCRGQRYQQHYIRGVPQHEMTIEASACQSGTTIRFLPDREIFGTTRFSMEKIDDWLRSNSDQDVKLFFH